jgi:hypothetical protein
MQGTEYLDDKPASYLTENRDGKTFFEFQKFRDDIKAKEVLEGIWAANNQFERPSGNALYHMIQIASELNDYGVTKQLANRLLEPFMWHTVIVTATEWENFFKLRCPQYFFNDAIGIKRSRRDMLAAIKEHYELLEIDMSNYEELEKMDTLWWLKINKGQADIHMMFLAEAIWDAFQESTPKLLDDNGWHIPYEDNITELFKGSVREKDRRGIPYHALISSVMCARVSYTVPSHDLTEWTETKYLKKAKELAEADPLHASPFEHCGMAMDTDDLDNFFKVEDGIVETGWCRNFRGFVQLRQIIEKKFST